jgi:hypothetical protein
VIDEAPESDEPEDEEDEEEEWPKTEGEWRSLCRTLREQCEKWRYDRDVAYQQIARARHESRRLEHVIAELSADVVRRVQAERKREKAPHSLREKLLAWGPVARVRGAVQFGRDWRHWLDHPEDVFLSQGEGRVWTPYADEEKRWAAHAHRRAAAWARKLRYRDDGAMSVQSARGGIFGEEAVEEAERILDGVEGPAQIRPNVHKSGPEAHPSRALTAFAMAYTLLERGLGLPEGLLDGPEPTG